MKPALCPGLLLHLWLFHHGATTYGMKECIGHKLFVRCILKLIFFGNEPKASTLSKQSKRQNKKCVLGLIFNGMGGTRTTPTPTPRRPLADRVCESGFLKPSLEVLALLTRL